jgi:MSHA biogenesis protein MshE
MGMQPLEALGMPADIEQRFRKLIQRSAGIVLVTGPTGSGKTTTLYSALNILNKPDTKIITVEDPVEYRLDRITQVQIKEKIGLDFSRVLRSVLRHDPDIIFVGEMRDRETVDIGLRAAITGHLVFSTLHTMSAIATIDRLIDMGAPAYMVAAAVHAVLAQRLVRRICADCSEKYLPDANELAWLSAQVGERPAAQMSFQHGVGCGYCNMTGYRGRVAIYELLELNRDQADAIRRNDLVQFAQITATRNDYVPLTRSAVDLAARGVTTIAEAMSAVSGISDEVTAPAPAASAAAQAAEAEEGAQLAPERVLSLLS